MRNYELEFQDLMPILGGVEFSGDWYQVWRANVYSRTATRILVRLGEFPAVHLSQLDKKARKFPWQEYLKAVSSKSRSSIPKIKNISCTCCCGKNRKCNSIFSWQ